MQLSRVAIAAVFFVVGALIVLPMVMKSPPSSRAASSTPTPGASVAASVSAGPSASPSSKRPSPTHTTKRPSTPPPPSVTPLVPLKVKIGAVRCPGRTVQVTVTNEGKQTEDYTITTDGSISVADRLGAGATRRSVLNLKEDHTTTISVSWHNVPVQSWDRHVNCAHKGSGKTLPHTGPDDGMIFARVATGVAAMVTGAIVFWYGRLWPRRRDKMLP